MKVHLAGVECLYKENIGLVKDGYNLISFYTMNKRADEIIKNSRSFLLDSGAFTFMQGKGKDIKDFEKYLHKYADFIVQNNIQSFFELDIDSVVGYEKVKEYRKKLENLTQRQCIPVWHSNRGIDDFVDCCKNYGYVALGGIVGNEWKQDKFKYMPWFIKTAHSYGAKIHGLGFTSTNWLKKIHFDSVDSTNWLFGKFGHYWEFTRTNDIVMRKRPDGKKVQNIPELQAHNVTEWMKFQKYADIYL